VWTIGQSCIKEVPYAELDQPEHGGRHVDAKDLGGLRGLHPLTVLQIVEVGADPRAGAACARRRGARWEEGGACDR
jgi:hypothetical protein